MMKTVIDVLRAFGGSFLGRDPSYYPRRAASEKIESKEMLDTIKASLKDFKFDANELGKADPKLLLDRAKDSLEEAKKQTEYQDAKAGRLLTIVAFLTAAVGTVFGKFIDLYPLHNGAAPASETSLWITGTYLLFGVYLLLVAAGALVTFHAMSTRFVWPTANNLADKPDVDSMLFWQQIIRTKPEAWGTVFAGEKGELLRTYYLNYVSEAYLVSAKVADKLRYLDPGQRLLILSIRVLFGLFLLIALTFTLVPPPPKAAAAPAAAPAAVAAPCVAGAPATAAAGEEKTASGNGQPTAATRADAPATGVATVASAASAAAALQAPKASTPSASGKK